MSDGNTVPLAGAPTVQIPPGFTPSAAAQPAVVADAPVLLDAPVVADAPMVVDAPVLADPTVVVDAPVAAGPPVVADAPVAVGTPAVGTEVGAQVVADAPVVDAPVVGAPAVAEPAVTPVPAVPPLPPAAAPLSPAAAPAASTPSPTPDAGATVTLPATPAAADPGTTKPAGESFATAAQADLDKASTALGAVDKESVQLDLDKEGVNDLLKLVSQARSLVDNVHSRAVNNLDVELKFGNNWVSDAISRRLREVAVGNQESAVNVIGDFMQVLFEVEETIRDAARNLERADDEAADAFGSAGEAKG